VTVAILGAGALGTLLGGRLAAAGEDVWLVCRRDEQARSLRERGVRIESRVDDDGPVQAAVSATTDASEVGHADLVVVLVKAHQTLAALDQHGACIGPDSLVVSLQNGLTNHHRLRDHVGPERTLTGVTYQGAAREGTGRVLHTNDGETVLGGPDAAAARGVAERFTEAGVATEAVEDPFEHVWEKQLWGVAIKPVAALSRRPNHELVADESLRALMERLLEEATAVAAARGYSFDAAAVHEDIVTGLAASPHTSSMLQDVRAGRRTEIDDVNGAVAALGREAGIPVPVNEAVARLVRGLQAGYLDGQ
jgi:2-dehydropantoate 2-reductase